MDGLESREATSAGRVRPFTVDEALTYSPISSIVPFAPEVIPLPTLQPHQSTPLLPSTDERSAATRALQSLNQQTYQSNGSSPALDGTLHDLQSLLDPSELTLFQFKTPPKPVPEPSRPITSNGLSNLHDPFPQLGSFADMVLRSTKVQFRYPSPTSPTSSPQPKRANASQKPHSLTPDRNLKNDNDGTFAANAQQQGSHHGLPTPEKESKKAAVLIPQLPHISYNEYQTFPVTGAGNDRGQSAASAGDDGILSRGLDEREKANVALNGLQGLLSDIFESEDQLEPDTSGAVSTSAANLFVPGTWSEGRTPVLESAVQIKVESSMRKVILAGRFDEISIDDLLRVQKLSEGALSHGETEGLRLDNEWSEEDVERWILRVDGMSIALRAARTILRTMTGSRKEKQLYSEELLQGVLNVLKSSLDSCVNPVAELRGSGDTTATFRLLQSHKKALTTVLTQSDKTLRLLTDLLQHEEVSETVITTIEFVTTGLIFVENAHSEKDSILGVQKFETLRVTAMGALIEIFANCPDQRTFIIDEILTSLERLPVTRQAARHLKLLEGGNIQLVSALIMRLVQTSTLVAPPAQERGLKPLSLANGSVDEGSDDEEAQPAVPERKINVVIDIKREDAKDPAFLREDLAQMCQPLLDSAQRTAHHVIQFLVTRALKSTKTGDDPYRVLLDIFAEDFVTVLNYSDWPAAELLLRTLLTSMVNITEGDKSSAPAKNMALDLMGLMGSAISDVIVQTRTLSKSFERSNQGLDGYLSQLIEEYLEGDSRESELLVWQGPYGAALASLRSNRTDDGRIASAEGYLISQWASRVCAVLDGTENENDGDRTIETFSDVMIRLKRMIRDIRQVDVTSNLDPVSSNQGRLGYALVLLTLPLCKAFERILLILLNSMNSDQATVRSKSIKSVVQLLEKDPAILDRGSWVMRSIVQRTYDPSPLVRDSAVGLLGKCLALKPDLEVKFWNDVLARTTDTQVGIRKRSMKILKDIYLRDSQKDVRSAIGEALLHRIKDTDDGVSELARQLFEEIWILPFHRPVGSDEETVQYRLALTEQAFLMVQTVQRGESVASVLESLLQTVLSNESKQAAANFRVCKSLVAFMFDETLDVDERSERPARQHILQTLTVFAKANPKLFDASQLELLQPYLGNLTKNDDLHVYRSIVVIFRWVIPRLSGFKPTFLTAVQGTLLASLSKLGKKEINEVVPCLWTINGILRNIERLSRTTISCIKGVYAARETDLTQKPELVARVIKYMTIAGLFGKYCDFDSDLARFRAEFPWWKGDSVSGLIVTVFAPFTRPKAPKAVRSAALSGLAAICQSWPKEFHREQVYTAYDVAFSQDDRDLQHIILQGFKDVLVQEERRSDRAQDDSDGDGETGGGRLGGSMTATQHDGIVSSLAQRFLQHIVRIATSTQDGYALSAAEVIASISRQGTLHPKECGAVLVVLETSQNAAIAGLAFREHRALHQKHETLLEKEYMKAVQQAFAYQKDVIGDARGATTHPYTAKLRPLFEVIKISKGKVRRKFLTNLCTRTDFDLSKVDAKDDVPPHLLFTRFLTENLAFFDYAAVDEILHVMSSMERIVAGTGTSIAHAIELEVPRVSAQLPDVLDAEAGSAPARDAVGDVPRLRQLTLACVILSTIWNTRCFLRQLYGLSSLSKQRDSKGKLSAKDLTRAPSKVPGVTGDKLWDSNSVFMSALEDSAAMTARCKLFVEMLAIDEDFKGAADGDDVVDPRLATPSEEEADEMRGPPSGSGKGRKRKAGMEVAGKGNKGRKRRRSMSKGKSATDESNDEDWV
ncbi:MAG: Sister chromatid cohesion protein 2 [Caeruleum heppii]|nr:MAG: Sister chromatid cohesion protein 2 [Caeruleum heppii]